MGRVNPNRHFLDIPIANGDAHSHLSSVTPLRLTTGSREESTRVQLQKQSLSEQHHAIVVSQKIPGVRTSAAFFASLRTNLRLNASPPPSPLSTPPSMRASTGSLPPPSPLSMAMDSSADQSDRMAPEDPLAGVPELKTYLTSDDKDKVAAMELVANGVAQMRQTANTSLIFHWLNMAVMVAIVSLVARYMYDRKHTVGIIGTTCAGIVITALALCRYATQGYLAAAQEINWSWLGMVHVIVTKFGDETIGTVMIDWVSGESRQRRKKAWRGEIKAWTVGLRYRRKGVGGALLEEAVKESRKKGAETIEFEEKHANSKRILPRLYNGKFDERDRRARELLQDLVENSPVRGKRRRGGST